MSDSSTQKRIAKNTVFLYIRMLLSLFVGLYTSRVVLQTLGVEDYGIYGVVGGVISMFSFLNAAMSGATSRFLTYELGRGDKQRLKDTFSSAMIIHIAIAIIVFVIGETVGLWFLCNKLVIPEERLFAAHVVYQLSILSMFFTVTQVPYNSIIVAHEKMDIYAYVELLNVFLKLGIVYLLMIGNWDKLILYAVLVLIVSILIALIYRLYCVRNYDEARFHWVWDKSLIKPMLSFSGWDLYGNMSVVVFTQGTAMLLNMFFGPVLNAANNVSMTVQGTIKSFAYNVIQAFRPQIIQQYAQGNMSAVNQFSIMATQYTLIMYSLIVVPVFLKAEYILQLWLGIVPEYTVFLLRVVLLATLFNLANNIVNIPIHASGRMKLFSILSGSCFIAFTVLMYVSLKCSFSVEVSYSVAFGSYIAAWIVSLMMLKRNVRDICMLDLLRRGYLKFIICIIPGLIVSYVTCEYVSDNLFALFLILLFNTLVTLISMYFVIMNQQDRNKLQQLVLSKFFHK